MIEESENGGGVNIRSSGNALQVARCNGMPSDIPAFPVAKMRDRATTTIMRREEDDRSRRGAESRTEEKFFEATEVTK